MANTIMRMVPILMFGPYVGHDAGMSLLLTDTASSMQ